MLAATQEQLVQRRLYAVFPADQHEFHPYFDFCYLKEEAINTRLTDVLGPFGWDKVVVKRQYIPAGEPVIEIEVPNPNGKGKQKAHYLLSNYPGEVITEDGGYFAVTRDDAHQITNRRELKVVQDIPVVMSHGYMTIRHTVDGVLREATRWSTGGDVLTDMGKERGARLLNTYKGADTDLLKRCARQFGVGLYLTQLSTANPKVKNLKDLENWIRAHYGPASIIEAKQMLIETLKGRLTPAEIGQRITAENITQEEIFLYFNEVLTLLTPKAA